MTKSFVKVTIAILARQGFSCTSLHEPLEILAKEAIAFSCKAWTGAPQENSFEGTRMEEYDGGCGIMNNILTSKLSLDQINRNPFHETVRIQIFFKGGPDTF
jgi:hypothetical protein